LNLIPFLQYYDTLLFQFLNHLIAHPLWDGVMVAITTKEYWLVPLAIVWIWLVLRGGARGRAAAVILLLAVGSSDWISARVIKPGVGRLRPCYELENVRLLVPCGGKHGFPSNHAANTFAAAMTLAYFYRRYTAVFVALSLLVGFSRIVVGVHYPGDVLGGFVLSAVIAAIFLTVYQKLESAYPEFFKKLG
jgi:undecaprenyl-diphosphatase